MVERIDLPAEHSGDAIGAIIAFETKRLLRCRIPDGHDKNKARVDGSFKKAEKEAISRDTCECSARRCRDENDAPYYRCDRYHLPQR